MAVSDLALRLDARRRRVAFELSQISQLQKALGALTTRVDQLTIANTMLFRQSAGFTYNGTVTNQTIDGIFIDGATGELVTAVKGLAQLGAGTCTVTWRKNGTNMTGFVINATASLLTVTPVAISLAPGDYIDLVITSASGASDLRATFVTEHTH